jgi:hypothetical protein
MKGVPSTNTTGSAIISFFVGFFLDYVYNMLYRQPQKGHRKCSRKNRTGYQVINRSAHEVAEYTKIYIGISDPISRETMIS